MNMIGAVYLTLSGILTYWAVRRATILGPPAIWNIYLFLSLVVYEWIVRSRISVRESVFSAMPLESIGHAYHEVYLGFIGIQAFALLSVVGLPRPKRNRAKLDAGYILHKVRYLAGPQALIVLVGLILASLVHFYSLDHELLWYNTEYKLIKDPDAIGATGLFSRFYHIIFRFVGLCATIIAVIYYHRRARIHLILALVLVTYSTVILLADNSRWVPLYFTCAAITNFLVSRRPWGTLTWISVALMLLTFAKVLTGRSLGVNGVSTIPYGFAALSVWEIPRYIQGFFTNIFESALNFANAVYRDAQHHPEYKLKSFSPLLGFMDNFEATRLEHQIKLAKVVPMGGLGELYSFGWVYILAFLPVCFLWLRITTKLVLHRTGISTTILIGMSLYIIMAIGSYSFRTSWRLMLFTIALAFALNWIRRLEMRRRNARLPNARWREARRPIPASSSSSGAAPAAPNGVSCRKPSVAEH